MCESDRARNRTFRQIYLFAHWLSLFSVSPDSAVVMSMYFPIPANTWDLSVDVLNSTLSQLKLHTQTQQWPEKKLQLVQHIVSNFSSIAKQVHCSFTYSTPLCNTSTERHSKRVISGWNWELTPYPTIINNNNNFAAACACYTWQ